MFHENCLIYGYGALLDASVTRFSKKVASGLTSLLNAPCSYYRNTATWADMINKRAQRAAGRSPEEKVKCHRGAIYRRPLMPSTKY